MPPAVPVGPVEPALEEEPESELSAFERRANLRAERHQLVASLRRLDGRSFNEINGWLNRQMGLKSVEAATIAQLERSIAMLLDELERVSRKGRSGAPAAAR
jgi:hypothetical protein